jgi:murein DD-endopeptidase MepM/ murein hydrolase activator NlpD
MVLIAADPARGESLNLILPTSNHALLEGDGPAFYQYTDRNFNGVKSRPWQGGQYGFVRNPKETAAGIVYTRFHEGVDIRPVYRDYDDEPLDTVRAIDDGYVVYANYFAGSSSYGKYVVVEHWWDGSPFYSLYAHLGSISVREGQTVRQGMRLGQMGYTGPGLNKRRAHLHFEINMMLNSRYKEWHETNYRTGNKHDIYNGVNLAGLDVAALYVALERHPDLTIAEFITEHDAYFRMAVPNNGLLDLTDRYGWLMDVSSLREIGGNPNSWEISFTASGLPVRIEASPERVSTPTVTAIRRSGIPYNYLTGGLVSGKRDNYSLGKSGARYASLLTLTDEERTVLSADQFSIVNAAEFDPDLPGDRLRTW